MKERVRSLEPTEMVRSIMQMSLGGNATLGRFVLVGKNGAVRVVGIFLARGER